MRHAEPDIVIIGAPAEPQWHRDGLVVAVLRLARWKHDPDVALLHSGTGGVILLVKGRPARNDR